MAIVPAASLYVIEIAKSRIKVGISTNPVRRLAEHRAMAEAHGCQPGREWTSPPGTGSLALETALVQHCEQQPGSTRYRNEYFAGVAFLVAVQCAAELCRDVRTLTDLGCTEQLRRWQAEASAAWVEKFDKALARSGGVPRVLLTVEESARWLRTSRAAVRGLVASGALPIHRGLRRIPAGAIRERLTTEDQIV